MSVFSLDLETGELRFRVNFQSATSAKDAYGQDQLTWATQVTQWAKITPLTGHELVNAQQIHALTSHAIEMRYNPDITPDATWRVQYGSRFLNPLAVINVLERNIKTVVLATEQVQPQP